MDVLRRKMGRPDAGAVQGAEKLWRLALARAARDELGLALDVNCQPERQLSLAEVIEALPDLSLIAVLDAAGGDCLGLFAASPALLSGLVALMTTGNAPLGSDATRKPTRTDAAMLAPLVDAALAGWAQELADTADAPWAGGWRYASHLEDARPLALLLEDGAYRLLVADVTLAAGGVAGQALLALPVAARSRRAVPAALPPDRAADDGQAFQAAFTRQVEGVAARIEAELVRLSLPLSRVMGLEAGEVLALGDATVGRLALRGVDGRLVAEGRLGQMRGMRAVRLSLPDAAALPVAS